VEALQKYKHFFKLNPPEPTTSKKAKHNHTNGKKRQHDDSEDDVSNSEDDSPYRFDLGAWRPRINKPDLAKQARTHFSSLPQPREMDVIVQFLYSVKTQGIPDLNTPLIVDKVLKIKPEN
jgi:Sin3 binding region of histone deacetylase complex subunit SAP30